MLLQVMTTALSFSEKEKKTCMSLMESRAEFKSFFMQLGNSMDSDEIENLLPAAEKYVCRLYPPVKRFNEVNKARHHMFSQNVKSGKIVDLSVIPPCSSVLRNQLFRAAYIANMWKNSKTAYIEQYQIDEYGWNRDGSMFWTDKSFPDDLEQIMEDEEYEKLCQEVPPFDELISEDEMGF